MPPRRVLVSGVVGVRFQNGEGAVDLFEQDDAREFVGDGHFAERQDGGSSFAGIVGEAVGRADGEDERLGIAVLVVLQELGEFFGGELPASGVEQDEGVGGARTGLFAEFEESGLVGDGEAFDFGVARDALEVLGGQGLDGGISGFADPGDFEFHRCDLSIGAADCAGEHRSDEHRSDLQRCARGGALKIKSF